MRAGRVPGDHQSAKVERVTASKLPHRIDGGAHVAHRAGPTATGITPGGGATQYLASRTTRGRALEIILGADLIDADTAERYGWINRALPADALDAFVTRLARNIASLPDGVIEAAKTAVPPIDLREGFVREHDAWARLFARPAAEQLIRGGLAAGAQTREGEQTLEATMRGVLEEVVGQAA